MDIDQGNILSAARVQSEKADNDSRARSGNIVVEDARKVDEEDKEIKIGAGAATGSRKSDDVESSAAEHNDENTDGTRIEGFSRARLIAMIVTCTGSAFLNVSLSAFSSCLIMFSTASRNRTLWKS